MLGSVHLEVEKCCQAINVSSILILSAGSEGPGCVAGRRQSQWFPFFVFPDPDALRNLAWFMIQATNRSGRHLGLISDS